MEYPREKLVPLLLLLVTQALAGAAHADESLALAHHDARLLSAQPDSPVAAIMWRGSIRAKISIPIPIVGANDKPSGFLLRMSPLIELHNDHSSGQWIPHQQWRGRLAIEGGWRWKLGLRAPSDSVVSLMVGVEHESDHQTTPYSYVSPSAVVLNDLSVRGDLTTTFGNVVATAALVERVHVLTCTVDLGSCSAGDTGSASFETGLEAIVDWGGTSKQRLRPYAALGLSWLFGRAKVRPERRIVFRTGVGYRSAHTGLWQLFFHLLAGNDVGIRRSEDVVHAGGGLSWSF